MRDVRDRALVERLGDRLRSDLAALVPAREPVALLDFPNHDNVGDAAIWLGELAWMRDTRRELVYASDHTGFCASELRRQLPPGGTILLHGGGNFGDLWPIYQRFREHVIAAFPDRRIVQLPQTVHFRDADALERTGAVLRRHPDFAICVRDWGSEVIARERLGVRAVLTCDMALALGPLRAGRARHEVLRLLRTDQERVEAAPAPPGIEADWPVQGPRWRALRQGTRYVGKLGAVVPPLAPLTAPLLPDAYERLARERLRAGLDLLSAGELLVTDRLHGHILALLAGVPQVLLDNSYGKLRGFWEAWTCDAATTRLAEQLAPTRAPVAVA
jgi:pyruvyl transferase EpsO